MCNARSFRSRSGGIPPLRERKLFIASMIKKILFITLSNFGDVILTLPVLDVLRERFPTAKITAMIGPRPKEVFENNPFIDKLIVYNKYAPLREKVKLFFSLKKEHFDIVIDLRNTLFGALLPCRFRTSPFLCIPSHIKHMRERNLYRLYKALKIRGGFDENYAPPSAGLSLTGSISKQDMDYVKNLLEKNNIKDDDKIVIIASVAGGANKRWEKEKFSQVAKGLSRDYKVILVARASEKEANQYIYDNCPAGIFDFSGLTTLMQLTYLIQRAALVIVCDTGVLQLASYLNTPILALFGASDEKKYGPWSDEKTIVSRELPCRRCQEAQCRFGT